MKILIKFNNNYMCFYDYKDFKDVDLSKTNILDVNDIALDESFINSHNNELILFLRKILTNNINRIYIDKMSICSIAFRITNSLNCFKYLYIKENKKINIEVFNYILNNKKIRYINCYDISSHNFETLNLSKKIKIQTRKKHYNDSYLFRLNSIETYSDCFYKKELVIDKFLNSSELNELKIFVKDNFCLEKIIIKYFNYKNLNNIINEIKNLKNIEIVILENDNNIKDILNDINKIKRKKVVKNKIRIKIKYENKYISKNILPAVNLNLLKIILIIIIISSAFFITKSMNIKKSDDQNNEKIEDKINDIVEDKEDIIIEDDLKTETPDSKSPYFQKYSKVFDELKQINSDTVAWLKINNTVVDYPVVQTTDNNKYLNYSFDNSKNINGWIFMDYRNNPNNLDKNTIIYGHSGNNKVMFGDLYKTINSNWYNNNHFIELDFKDRNTKWQIFSIYIVPVTNDYLSINFNNDESFINFINLIKNRSINNFNINVTSSDKILTISTCYKNSSNRLVIHAKLVN